MLSDDDIEKRLPVWEALSDLLLDTELSDIDYQHIGRTIVASGYSPEEISDLFWNEVFPACGDNLRSIAGEWAGFSPDWLRERILSVLSQDRVPLLDAGIISKNAVVEMTKQELFKLWQYLPRAYCEALLAGSEPVPVKTALSFKKWWRFW